MKQKKDKFISVTEGKVAVLVNVSHIIKVQPITKQVYKKYTEKQKTWFGFGEEIEVEKRKYVGREPCEGACVTTTARNSIGGSSHYQYGGDNKSMYVKESPAEILRMIGEA